jgi:hypothetical protein
VKCTSSSDFLSQLSSRCCHHKLAQFSDPLPCLVPRGITNHHLHPSHCEKRPFVRPSPASMQSKCSSAPHALAPWQKRDGRNPSKGYEYQCAFSWATLRTLGESGTIEETYEYFLGAKTSPTTVIPKKVHAPGTMYKHVVTKPIPSFGRHPGGE